MIRAILRPVWGWVLAALGVVASLAAAGLWGAQRAREKQVRKQMEKELETFQRIEGADVGFDDSHREHLDWLRDRAERRGDLQGDGDRAGSSDSGSD